MSTSVCSDVKKNTTIFNYAIRFNTDSHTLNSYTITISDVFVSINEWYYRFLDHDAV